MCELVIGISQSPFILSDDLLVLVTLSMKQSFQALDLLKMSLVLVEQIVPFLRAFGLTFFILSNDLLSIHQVLSLPLEEGRVVSTRVISLMGRQHLVHSFLDVCQLVVLQHQLTSKTTNLLLKAKYPLSPVLVCELVERKLLLVILMFKPVIPSLDV